MPYIKQLFGAPGSIGIPASYVQGLTATANSRLLSCTDSGASILVIDLSDGGSFSSAGGTLAVRARLAGAGQHDSSGQWTMTNLSYINRGTYTSSAIAGSTVFAVAVPAILEYDITGLEAQIVYTRSSDTGTLNVRCNQLDISP